jgi:hypothetical protein
MTRTERLALAQKRLLSVLRTYVLATDRTLEQKISDAGPTNQRIEPGILTRARGLLVANGRVVALQRGRTTWFHLAESEQEAVQNRLAELEPIYLRTQDGNFKRRVGQALEIAVMKALAMSEQAFLGGFSDLGEHDDREPYNRVEPPLTVSGKKIEKGPLDYISFPAGFVAGIEVKNYRTWLYPDSAAVRELLWKSSDVGAVPVLIARRVPFITFRLLNLSGGLVHQTYNQLYPAADAELGGLVRDKRWLGYHDVRNGNDPDVRLQKFIGQDLPGLMADAKRVFEIFRETHNAYGKGEMLYYDWLKEILQSSGIWGAREEEPDYGPDDLGGG